MNKTKKNEKTKKLNEYFAEKISKKGENYIKNYKIARDNKRAKQGRRDVSFLPRTGIFSILKETRMRKKIPRKIINKVKARLDKLPKRTYKKKLLDDKYSWGGINKKENNLPACTIDLPIIKVKAKNKNYHKFKHEVTKYPKWKKIRTSCIVVDEDTNRILAIFIYARDDKNISRCLKNAFRLAELMDKHLKLKSKFFYSGYAFKIKSGFDKHVDKNEEQKQKDKYTGKNWLEGLQNYFHASIGRRVISYYHRNPAANDDEEYLEELLWLYCCLYELEKRHCPAIAKHRYDLVKDLDSPGCFPGCPIELNPSTCMGGSISFSSDTHADSSVRGTTETIIWRPDKTNPKPYIFNNSLAEMYFDINEDCMIYQVGTDPHGTLNTGNHGGVGFVNLTKKNLSADTKLVKQWYKLWNNVLNKR